MRVWLAAVVVYIIAIAGRTSFGVVGVIASDRFSISAGALATLVVVHLGVYALAQVPVGLALDRFGPRLMLGGGALLLAAGQLAVALAPSYGWAVAARVLVGAGDATAFVSVIRLIPAWFPACRIPLMTQLTAILGQAGPIISAVPFLATVRGFGWSAGFISLAAAGVLVALLAFLAIRDVPGGGAAAAPPRDRVATIMSSVTAHPGAWLGFFTHFTLLFSPNVFLILWGMPLLTVGQGYSAATAAALISLNSLAGVIAGPAVAAMLVRHPWQRALLVLFIIGVLAATWAAVLVPSGQRPLWLWALLVIVLAFGGAGSSIGFDIARTSLPPHHYGTASGLVNMGGFISSIAAVWGIGLVLDYLAPDKNYTNDDFRLALAVMVPIALIGVAGIVISRALMRRRLATEGVYPMSVPQIVRHVTRGGRLPRRRRRGVEGPQGD